MEFGTYFIDGKPEFIVAGLGNPGPRYSSTRHNVGFLAIDYIAEKKDTKINREKFNSLTGKCYIAGYCALLLKPQTMMNNSGLALARAADYFRIPPENIIVLYDDIALPVGAMRIRPSGSAGGHNGLKSIIDHLGTNEFQRIRFGIGAKPAGSDLADYVLSNIPYFDKPYITDNFKYVLPALELIFNGKTQFAMSKYNRPGKTEQTDESNS